MPKYWVNRSLQANTSHEALVREYSLTSLDALKSTLTYTCKLNTIGDKLRSKFIKLSATNRTLEQLSCHPRHSIFACWLRTMAGIFMSNTDANAYLEMYHMHVVDRSQLAYLLGEPEARANGINEQSINSTLHSFGRAIDIGAGDGGVTLELAPLFSEIVATEASQSCVDAIARKGIEVVHTQDLNAFPSNRYDVVMCFNVLDRCSCPQDLIFDMHRLAVQETGRIILAVALPFRPYVECGPMGKKCPPEQDLKLNSRASWEEAVNEFVEKILTPNKLEVLSFSRVPYLCQGDVDSPYYVLDDAVFVLRPVI
uniref:Methyltransferase domain-containing protein n=1 Tax=Hanusia phi TaxID=3032 RepID=A0A7S0EUT0_9CRYP|mmetsp:Transcript_31658/g.71204  ORF Transcript_31658/g.71204 Transcript_31658/m.71204 type:complete len:312 (+) Transcript_31658:131-1066(+)